MKNKPRLLTVRQFAEEKNVTRPTVLKWIRDGRLKGIIKDPTDTYYLIPESNLSYLPVRGVGRPRLYEKRPPISSEEEARERYDGLTGAINRKVRFSFDELKTMLEEDMTYNEIAEKAGVSRQAIEQLHSKYFAFFISSAKERRRNRSVRDREMKINSHFKKITKLSILRRLAEKAGFEVKPIPSKACTPTSRSSIAIVNGKRCGVRYMTVAAKTCERGNTFYYRSFLVRKVVSDTEFTIFLTGKKDPKVFVVPSKLILSITFDNPSSHRKMVYLPRKRGTVYNNNYPDIDWYDYENGWDQLR